MENTIDIYTDASYFSIHNIKKNIFGYSAVILTDDRDFILKGTISKKTIRDYFKLDCTLGNIHIAQGEMIAISKALWQFRNDSFDIRIFSDSITSLNYIKKIMNGEEIKRKFRGKYLNLVKFIIGLIERIESNGGSVELSWVKGHGGCVGNNLADKFAKDMFVPNLCDDRINMMSKNQKKKFNKLSKKNKRKFKNERISQEIYGLSADFFYEKETNEFGEYKESLVFKTDIRIEETMIFNNYSEILKTTLQKVNINLFKIKNGNRIQATV